MLQERQQGALAARGGAARRSAIAVATSAGAARRKRAGEHSCHCKSTKAWSNRRWPVHICLERLQRACTEDILASSKGDHSCQKQPCYPATNILLHCQSALSCGRLSSHLCKPLVASIVAHE